MYAPIQLLITNRPLYWIQKYLCFTTKNHLKLCDSYMQWWLDWKSVLSASKKNAPKNSISMIHNVLIDFMQLFVVHVTPATDCNDVSQQVPSHVIKRSTSVHRSRRPTKLHYSPCVSRHVRKHRLSGVCCRRAPFPFAEIVPKSTSIVSTPGTPVTQSTSHRTGN